MKKDIELSETIKARLISGTRERIFRAIKDDSERFDSESHFIRVAIMRLLKEVKQ